MQARYIYTILSFMLIYCSANSQDSLGYFYGSATYYDFNGRGNCSFRSPTKPVLTAAVNTRQYDCATLCGACLQVIGSRDTVVVRVEDRCPGCKPGGLDLSKTAFATIENIATGRAQVKWKIVPCPSRDPIMLYFTKSSNTCWASFIVLNHPLPIKKISFWSDSAWAPIERKNHNYFVMNNPGRQQFSVKVEDYFGGELLLDSICLLPGKYVKPYK